MSQTGRKTSTAARSASHNERGQTIIILAFAAVALFAMVGLAVDAGRLFITKAELSRAVDAAALSGVLEFDGTAGGLSKGEVVCEAYFADNEPTANPAQCIANGDKNEMEVDASKDVGMIFLGVLGINQQTVSAHAKAGFGTQYMDVVMVLDATPSMAGSPIENAKSAAVSFKDILLGTSPAGNVLVGMTPFRGCYQPEPLNYSDCIDMDTQISGLTYDSPALQSKITNITASSGGGTSATNVCTGLAKGWEIMNGTYPGEPNHDDDDLYPDNQQYMVLLSDGDNAYWGNVTYQNDGTDWVGTLDPFSPNGATVDGTDYPCMPYLECDGPWGGQSNNSDRPCESDTIFENDVGQLSDSDGSSPQTCNDVATPRERQMDARTIHLAQAIKATGVEIFVVAFSGGVPYCDLGNSKIYNDEEPSHCNSVVQSPAGPIGNTDDDDHFSDPANLRLLKCIASSDQGDDDHYFYASSDSELVEIFTQIANRINHRLIE